MSFRALSRNLIKIKSIRSYFLLSLLNLFFRQSVKKGFQTGRSIRASLAVRFWGASLLAFGIFQVIHQRHSELDSESHNR